MRWGDIKKEAEKQNVPDDAMVSFEMVDDKYYQFYSSFGIPDDDVPEARELDSKQARVRDVRFYYDGLFTLWGRELR
jgi:hypothetical protein